MLTQCATCSSLMSSHAYESHRYVHDSTDRSFMCERGCMEMFFETADELEMHKKFMHGKAQGNFTQLRGATAPKQQLKEPCTICLRTIPIANMQRHMTLHSPTGRPFKCSRGCLSTYFTTGKRLSDHNLRVHKKKSTPTCTGIDDSVADQLSMEFRNHQPIQPTATALTACTVCSRILRAHNMEQHMVCHSPTGRPFSCADGCLETHFTTAQYLKSHRRKFHGIMPETTCKVCGVEDVKPNITQHMKTHDSTGKPFQCIDGCVKTFFNTRENHASHRRDKHNKYKIRPKSLKSDCTVCGKPYLNNHMLQHMIVHNSDGRPFKCDDGCKETYFASKKNLQKHQVNLHRANPLRANKITSTRSESPPAGAIAPLSVEPTVTSTALRSINNKPTVKTMIKMEPTSPMAKRARLTSTFDDENSLVLPSKSVLNSSHENQNNNTISKTCSVCRMVVKKSLKLHMKVHMPSDFPCTFGCVKTFAKSSDALRKHFYKFHHDRSTPTSRRRRSPSLSSSASVSESSIDDSEDDNWRDPKTKKSKFTVLGKSTALSQKHGPTAISTPLARGSRKRQICTVSPIVRAEKSHEERVTVVKSVPTPITNVVEQPLVSADVKKFSGENNQPTRHSLMMQLINLPSNASEEERTQLLDIMESCE